MEQFFSDLYDELQRQGYQARKTENKIVVCEPYDDDVEVTFVPEKHTGVPGGTIEVGYENADESDASFHLSEASVDEVVAVVREIY